MSIAGTRITLVMAAFIVFAAGATAARAQEPVTPSPGADEIGFVGLVPAAPGSPVTLKAMDLDVGLFSDCQVVTSFASAGDAPNTARFEVLASATCLEQAEAVMLCWSAAPEDCAVLAAPASLSLGVPSISDLLGQTVDVGLLTPRLLDTVETPPEADTVASSDPALPPAGGGGSQHGEYRWLVWAGVASLAAGLVFAGASFALSQRRRAP